MPPLFLSFAVWMVWSVGGRRTAKDRLSVHHQPAVLAGGGAGNFRCGVASWPIPSSSRFSVDATGRCSAPRRCCCRPCGWRWQCRTRRRYYAVFVAYRSLCAGWAAAISPPSWPISASSFRSGCRARRSGWNAGAGNLGVGVMQAVVSSDPSTAARWSILGLGSAQTHPRSGAVVTKVWLQNAGFIWVPFIIAATIARGVAGPGTISAAPRRPSVNQLGDPSRKHAWILAWLYTGTFGSLDRVRRLRSRQLLSTLYPRPPAPRRTGPSSARFSGPWSVRSAGGCPTVSAAPRVTFWNFVGHAGLRQLPVLALSAFGLSNDGGGAVVLRFVCGCCSSRPVSENGSVFHVVPSCLPQAARYGRAGGKTRGGTGNGAISEGEIEASVALGIYGRLSRRLGCSLLPCADW